MTGGLTFRLLGPLEVLAGGRPVHVGAPRQLAVLAILLLEPGRVISMDRLIEAVWDESPPASARSQVQICVSSLRKTLNQAVGLDPIETASGGYRIAVDDGALDVTCFRRLVASGRAAARSGNPTGAVGDLRQALNLFRGKAAADVDSRLVQAVASCLNEEQVTVHEECLGLELSLGQHLEAVHELRELVVAHPLRERLRAHLVLALYRSGRQSESLSAYRQARRTFADDLGLDLGEELRTLEQSIITSDPSLLLSTELAGSRASTADGLTLVPRQLPAAINDFVDRTETVADMRARLTPGGRRSGAQDRVEVLAVRGRSGVGKTALALHVAHAVRDDYPDGQLFAHMRDNEARPLRPEHVLARFLRDLGVPAAMLPEPLADLEALYRSQLAERRVLVVLDDVTSIEQVTPLVPGRPGCALIVTSRQVLSGLAIAHRYDLDVFSRDVSTGLLSDLLGDARVGAEPQAAEQLASLCDNLPLALRVAAAKLADRSHWSVGQMVSRLADERRRLDELSDGRFGVRASISLSYADLSEPARKLLLLLSTLGPNGFAHWVAAPLMDMDVADSDDRLGELVAVRLVETRTSADGSVRFQLHDLVRIFAVEVIGRDIPVEEIRRAESRLLRCWLFLLCAAHRREFVSGLHSDAVHWVLRPEVTDHLTMHPIAWFQLEHSNLVEAIRLAAEIGEEELCWDLTLTAADFFESQGDFASWRRTTDVALAAVCQTGNRRGEAAMLYSRGGSALIAARLNEAEKDSEAALTLFEESGDAYGRALVLCTLSVIDRWSDRSDLALDRLQCALPALRTASDASTEAYVYNNMAKIKLKDGRPDEAELLLWEGIAVCPRRGTDRVFAQLTYWLGEVYRHRGEFGRAEVQFEQVLRMVSGTSDPIGKANALLSLGRVRAARHDLEGADVVIQFASETAEATGDRVSGACVLLALTELSVERGDFASANASLEAADALVTGSGLVFLRPEVGQWRERLSRHGTAATRRIGG